MNYWLYTITDKKDSEGAGNLFKKTNKSIKSHTENYLKMVNEDMFPERIKWGISEQYDLVSVGDIFIVYAVGYGLAGYYIVKTKLGGTNNDVEIEMDKEKTRHLLKSRIDRSVFGKYLLNKSDNLYKRKQTPSVVRISPEIQSLLGSNNSKTGVFSPSEVAKMLDLVMKEDYSNIVSGKYSYSVKFIEKSQHYLSDGPCSCYELNLAFNKNSYVVMVRVYKDRKTPLVECEMLNYKNVKFEKEVKTGLPNNPGTGHFIIYRAAPANDTERAKRERKILKDMNIKDYNQTESCFIIFDTNDMSEKNVTDLYLNFLSILIAKLISGNFSAAVKNKNQHELYELSDSQDEDLDENLFEGAKKTIIVNAYERNTKAIKKCKKHHGYKCSICGFEFKEIYGEVGEEFIIVHHIKPLNEIDKKYKVDPINDLIPVCANCHAIIHRKKPAFTIEEIKNMIGNKS
jgi:predicted HNH restriction endonuclease